MVTMAAMKLSRLLQEAQESTFLPARALHFGFRFRFKTQESRNECSLVLTLVGKLLSKHPQQ